MWPEKDVVDGFEESGKKLGWSVFLIVFVLPCLILSCLVLSYFSCLVWPVLTFVKFGVCIRSLSLYPKPCFFYNVSLMRDVVVLLSKHIDRFVKSHFPDYEEVYKCSVVAYLVCRVLSCVTLCYLVLPCLVLVLSCSCRPCEGAS